VNVPFVRERATSHADAMIAWFLGLSQDTAGRVTDLNAGSVIRTLLEAVAIRLEYLDNKVFAAMRRLIPEVLFEFLGEGDGLTSTVGFPRRPAVPASGPAIFTRDLAAAGAVVIPAGTRVTVRAHPNGQPLRIYTTVTDAVIGATQTEVAIQVQATTHGPNGNTPAATLELLDQPEGVASTRNDVAFINGAVAESDEARRKRFVLYIQNLARAQLAGLEWGARTARRVVGGVVVEDVRAVRAVQPADKRGLVRLYIDNGGGTASAALVALAQRTVDGSRDPDGVRVPGYKAAGIVVETQAVVPIAQAVRARLVLHPRWRFVDVVPVVTQAIHDQIAALGIADTLYLTDLICAAVGVEGVQDVLVETPAANVVPGIGQRILPGVFTLTEAT